jgi:hypothetical protein
MLNARQGAAVPAPTQNTSIASQPYADWTSLERLLGPELCGDYMFMGRTANIALYKHIITRRYLNIDCDGDTYRFNATTGGYDPIDRATAIAEVQL